MTHTTLVADDEGSIVNVVADILGDAGYRVITASDGAEALSLLGSARPDLLLTDQMMPFRTGLELIAYLQEQPEYTTVVVLMSVTRATPIPPTVTFLPKPFLIDALLDAVAARLPAS